MAIPSAALPNIEKRYSKLRKRLPKANGEVKGRLLNEAQVASVVSLLARNQAVFEVTVLDVGAHTAAYVTAYQEGLAKGMEDRLPRFNVQAQPDVQRTVDQIRKTSTPLFLQAITTFDLLHTIIKHIPMYFAQRQPAELGSFSWLIDGKDAAKVTEWEKWWTWYAHGALFTRSRTDPRPQLVGADYSYFDRFNDRSEPDAGIDLGLLLDDLRFSSEPEVGLELVDIVVNAVRRAMVGNLGKEGWFNIPRLMIHRRDHYITLMLLGDTRPPDSPSYTQVVRHFVGGGKSMLSPYFQRMADESA